MRYCWISDRTPRPRHGTSSYCAWCCTRIGFGYLREHGTRLIYCSPDCFEEHCKTAAGYIAARTTHQLLLEDAARRVS